MKLTFFGIFVLAGAVTSLSAAPITYTYDFSSATGTLATTHSYSSSPSGAPSLTSAGFNSSGTATDLYGKNDSGDEKGVGLTNDPTGDHEITAGSFVQIDLNSLTAAGTLSNLNLMFGSTTNGETWKVYETNTAGSLSGASLLGPTSSGTTDQSFVGFNLPTDRYIDVTQGTAGTCNEWGCDNILLSQLKVGLDTGGGGGASVPEPATLGLAGFALAGLGLLKLRKRAC
jgi:PEP-CTERM motif-containing protein